jgi:very-short-patch-repair endonuclease
MRPQLGEAQGEGADEVIARIATAAHGVVTRDELLRAGVTVTTIRRRLERGALIPVHRGVYRVGHLAPSYQATFTAAVKAGGNEAALCGRAAAHMWGLVKGRPPQPEILAPGKRQIPGVLIHRCQGIDSTDITTRDGVHITTIERTLVDLACSLPVFELGRACHEADVRYRVTPEQVEAVLARRPSSPGAGALRRILHGDQRISLSRLELRFLRRLRTERLPIPETNRLAGGRRVDCRWPEHRLTVELDGFRYHRSRHAWEQDRRREREARARGDEFRRYTWGDVADDPTFMLSELRELLSTPRTSPT